jgi:hypothetical protein
MRWYELDAADGVLLVCYSCMSVYVAVLCGVAPIMPRLRLVMEDRPAACHVHGLTAVVMCRIGHVTSSHMWGQLQDWLVLRVGMPWPGRLVSCITKYDMSEEG